MDIATLGLEVKSDGVVVAKNRLRDFERQAGGAERSAGVLTRTMRALAPAIAAVTAAFGVRAIAQYSDAWSTMQWRLRNATGSAEGAAAAMERISSVARNTWSSLDQTAESFLRQEAAMSALGYTAQQQLDHVEALNGALLISGLRGQRAEQVAAAWARAMSRGALRGDEFNSVVENSSRLTQALADAMGVNVTELRGLAEQGKITSDVMFGITGSLADLRKELEGDATLAGSLVVLGNSLMELIGRVDGAANATSSLGMMIVGIADNIRALTPVMEALASLVATTWGHVTTLAGSLINMLSPAIGLIIDNMGILVGAFATFMAIKIAIFLGTAAGAMIHFARTVRTLGLVMAAVTSLTRLKMTAILLLGGAIAQVTGTTEVLVGWIEDLGRSIYNALPEDMQKGVKDLSASLTGLGNEIEGLEGGRTFHELDKIAKDAAGSVGEVGKAVSGVSAATAAANDNFSNMARIGQQVTQTLASGFSNIFKTIVTGTGSAIEAVGQLLSRLGDLFIDNAFQMLFGGMFGGLFGGGGNIMTSLGPRIASFTPGIGWMSMEGGGFTGYGPRSGGIDGRGGFPAILHPNETVIDHTRPANQNHHNDNSRGDLHIHINGSGLTEEQLGRAIANGIREYDGALAPKVEAKFRQMQTDPRTADGAW